MWSLGGPSELRLHRRPSHCTVCGFGCHKVVCSPSFQFPLNLRISYSLTTVRQNCPPEPSQHSFLSSADHSLRHFKTDYSNNFKRKEDPNCDASTSPPTLHNVQTISIRVFPNCYTFQPNHCEHTRFLAADSGHSILQ